MLSRVNGKLYALSVLSILISLLLLVSLLYKSVVVGISYIDLNFLFSNVESAGKEGGIYPIVLSTFYILILSILISLPISFACAIELNELKNKGSKFYSIFNKIFHILASLPSIVVGLFGNLFFCYFLGFGYSMISGALTICCMTIPILSRSIELSFRTIPSHYYQLNDSLGLQKINKYIKVYIPMIKSSLQAGIVLSMGRVLAETAALLFTSGYGVSKPESFFDSARTLSIHIYDLSMNIVGGDQNAYKSVFVLMLLVMLCNLSSRFVLRNKISMEL